MTITEPFFIIISFFLYYTAPSELSTLYVLTNVLLFALGAYKVLKNDRQNINIFNFNLLFLLSFFMCTYFLPLLVIPAEGLYSVDLVFDYETMNKCVSLATIGITVYSWIYLLSFRKYRWKGENFIIDSIKLRKLSGLSRPFFNIVFFAIFVILIRFMNTSHEVAIEVDGPPFVFVFFIVATSLSLMLAAVKYDFKQSTLILFLKRNRGLLVKISLVCFLYLLIGDRLVIIQLASISMAIYSIYVSEFKFKTIVAAGIIGFVMMTFISLTRGGDSSLRSGDLGASMSAASAQMDNSYNGNMLSAASDLSERFMELCVGYDYVQKHGVQYPLKIIPLLLSPMPLLPNLITQLIYGVPMAETASGFAVGQDTNTSAGSHCVLSVYMHWGVPGVIIGFAIYGYIIALISSRIKKSIYYSVSYMVLISAAFFTPRADLFDIYRPIIWAIFLIWFLSNIKLKKTRV